MQLNINAINKYEFTSFVKKLLSIDKFIFMKMNFDETKSSVYLPQRDAVKLVNVNTRDLFNFDDTDINDIKVSFYNGTRVIEALSHFDDQIRGTIVYSEIDDELLASDFIIESDNLKVNLACTDPTFSFMEMNKDETEVAFNIDSEVFRFELLTAHIEKIKSLSNLDKDEDIFSISLSNNNIYIKSTSYEALLCPSISEGEHLVYLHKKYINLLDKENYRVVVCENKIVFESLDTDTKLTVAVAIVDED